jgi:hypothetical protein
MALYSILRQEHWGPSSSAVQRDRHRKFFAGRRETFPLGEAPGGMDHAGYGKSFHEFFPGFAPGDRLSFALTGSSREG